MNIYKFVKAIAGLGVVFSGSAMASQLGVIATLNCVQVTSKARYLVSVQVENPGELKAYLVRPKANSNPLAPLEEASSKGEEVNNDQGQVWANRIQVSLLSWEEPSARDVVVTVGKIAEKKPGFKLDQLSLSCQK